jgi:hypothetical protein
MKRYIIIFLIVSLFLSVTEAQSDVQLWKMKRYEAVAGLGPSFFFADIGGFVRTKNILGFRDITFLQTRYNLNLNLRYRITHDINVRLSVTYGTLHATDARGSNVSRGFKATTSVFESAIMGEYCFIKNKVEDSYLFEKGKKPNLRGVFKSLDFYVFAGIGGLNYNVTGNSLLQAAGYEKGGFTAVVPAGIGTAWIYSSNINLGIELSGRYSFSDALDGLTSQYSTANDVYYFLNFTVTYKMKSGPKGLRSFRR